MNTILNIILKPLKLLLSLVRKIEVIFEKRRENERLAIQENDFNLVGLERHSGLIKLSVLYSELFNEEYCEDNDMLSEHLILLSSISLKANFKCHKILEIGTFNAKTSAIISRLFPNANITTIDLPSSNDLFQNTYCRENNLNEFLIKRNELLIKCPNISFIEMNSIALVNFDANEYDLVWIDGAHGYPVVALDIINAYRITRNHGLILVDDVWLNKKDNDAIYSSVAAYETLLAIKDANLVDSFRLFFKRIGGEHNIKSERKYVGFFQKP